MHFAAVYVAGRLQGASHAEAMHVAIASQAMDDYRNLAAPSLKIRAVGTEHLVGGVVGPVLGPATGPLVGSVAGAGTVNNPAIEAALDKFSPKQEFSPNPLPRHKDFLGFIHENPALENRLANNAHALGVTRAESQEVARLGIATDNLTTFGLGLHTVGDFLPHANTTGKPTFGHQIGKNEDYTDSNPLSTSADQTSRNPRKALATFMDVMDLWSEKRHTAGGPVKLDQHQLNRLDFFLRSSDASMKMWALEELLESAGATKDEIDAFRKASSDPNDRRSRFEAQTATTKGQVGFQRAIDTWLSRENDGTLVTRKTDVKPYTDDPRLPNIAHYQFARIHHYAAHPHFQP
jgi:hypothetical protein